VPAPHGSVRGGRPAHTRSMVEGQYRP
jgi:hypothetical protein